MAQLSVDSDIDEDPLLPKSNQRRVSLADPKPFPDRDSFQRRSLQDFSDRINRTAQEEAELQRRQAELASVSSDASTDSTDLQEGNSEWRQVGRLEAWTRERVEG